MQIRTVVFDLDGTLIDSLPLILASYRHTMETHRGRRLDDELWIRGVGTPLAVQMRQFAESDEEAVAMVATYTEHNLRYHDELVKAYPDVAETVGALREAGLKLAIATSKRRVATLMGLKHCGLPEHWFAGVITADDVANPKPHPEPVRLALEAAGEQDPAKAAYVGDSVHDMQSGRAAGVTTVAALWGPNSRTDLAPAGPDLWMKAPAELLGLVG